MHSQSCYFCSIADTDAAASGLPSGQHCALVADAVTLAPPYPRGSCSVAAAVTAAQALSSGCQTGSAYAVDADAATLAPPCPCRLQRCLRSCRLTGVTKQSPLCSRCHAAVAALLALMPPHGCCQTVTTVRSMSYRRRCVAGADAAAQAQTSRQRCAHATDADAATLAEVNRRGHTPVTGVAAAARCTLAAQRPQQKRHTAYALATSVLPVVPCHCHSLPKPLLCSGIGSGASQPAKPARKLLGATSRPAWPAR